MGLFGLNEGSKYKDITTNESYGKLRKRGELAPRLPGSCGSVC
ncbi:hypothetical protein GCWU000325_02512 [Alloprevotella tannerae ATCC 51259]|uniref:Uncharacterized protein n=1 Tax=Alloprevotella tannerae ATCC 51259 TaxID=626522 RepID=C9LJU8_9BACT|nr:hypothetical protein GCWU000325_02512 [Alloprevotella tannerae ATCC 51259]